MTDNGKKKIHSTHYTESNINFVTPTKNIKRFIWLFFERPSGKIAVTYHTFVFVLVLGSLALGVLTTMNYYESHEEFQLGLLMYEVILLIVFFVEFCLRTWSCTYVGRYQGLGGRLRFLGTLYMLIDIVVIIAAFATLILQLNASFTILRVTRFLQILRILRVDRKRGDLRLMVVVVRQHSKELLTCYFVGFIILFAGSYVVYVSEKYTHVDEGILNMADGLYWAVITVTSVGYGDFSPKSWPGKYLAAVFAVVGCAFFSLPAGILGSGFALQVNKQKKEKRVRKIRHPAAILIQTGWRNYMVNKCCMNATWYSLLPQLRSSNKHAKSLQGLVTQKFHRLYSKDKKNGDYYTNDLLNQGVNSGTHNHEKAEDGSNHGLFTKYELHLPGHTSNSCKVLTRQELVRTIEANKISQLPRHRKSVRNAFGELLRSSSSLSIAVNNKETETNDSSFEIIPKYRGAIRFYVQCKYWLAVRRFKDVRQPYVNVQDLMESAAQDHLELIANMKEMNDAISNLHRKFDELQLNMNQFPSHGSFLKQDTTLAQATFPFSTVHIDFENEKENEEESDGSHHTTALLENIEEEINITKSDSKTITT